MNTLVRMADKLFEGVFAINKPPSISSAQVLRDLQHTFAKSKTFAPLLAQTDSRIEQHGNHVKRRRISKDNVFKMGHGGTLDPLATGVLIVGIGRGTKHLQNFLECTKTYETVVMFGKSTDTYDIAGKVIDRARSDHLTRELVEEKLSSFRGRIKQVPPIYSALKIDGMKAYDYARTGKELPRELESREMNVTECTLLDWYEGGKHDFRWPIVEASEEEKSTAKKLMAMTTEINDIPREEKAALHTHAMPELNADVAKEPAARIRLTVSSGFYVRSFAHDLGVACQSFGSMAELNRTRQGDYTLANPAPKGLTTALERNDLETEDTWGPKIQSILNDWLEKNPIVDKPDDRDRPQEQRKERKRRPNWKRRRNSSSPDT